MEFDGLVSVDSVQLHHIHNMEFLYAENLNEFVCCPDIFTIYTVEEPFTHCLFIDHTKKLIVYVDTNGAGQRKAELLNKMSRKANERIDISLYKLVVSVAMRYWYTTTPTNNQTEFLESERYRNVDRWIWCNNLFDLPMPVHPGSTYEIILSAIVKTNGTQAGILSTVDSNSNCIIKKIISLPRALRAGIKNQLS